MSAREKVPPVCPKCKHRPCRCPGPKGEKSEEERLYWEATARDGKAIVQRIGQAHGRRRSRFGGDR